MDPKKLALSKLILPPPTEGVLPISVDPNTSSADFISIHEDPDEVDANIKMMQNMQNKLEENNLALDLDCTPRAPIQIPPLPKPGSGTDTTDDYCENKR